jgi:hypothetical protein
MAGSQRLMQLIAYSIFWNHLVFRLCSLTKNSEEKPKIVQDMDVHLQQKPAFIEMSLMRSGVFLASLLASLSGSLVGAWISETRLEPRHEAEGGL